MKKLIVASTAFASFLAALVALAQTQPNGRRPRTAAEAERLAPTPPPVPPPPSENDRLCATGRRYPNAMVSLRWSEWRDPADALHVRLVGNRSRLTLGGCSPFETMMVESVQSVGVDQVALEGVPGGWQSPRDEFGYGGLNGTNWERGVEDIPACDAEALLLAARFPASAFCGLRPGERPSDREIQGGVRLLRWYRAYRPAR